MKTKPKPKLNRQILDEASSWFVDFRVGDVDAGARERFDQWLRQSPEHIRAYMEISKTYVELPAGTPDGKVDVEGLIARARSESQANVVPLDRAGANQASMRQDIPSRGSAGDRTRGRRFALRALAASLALAILGGGLFVALHLTRDPVYATDIGERRSITLAEGSTIDLNARSRIRVHLTEAERDVELLTGQALFEVAKDPARPFIVQSGGTWVRAVGTQFQVDRKSGGVTVTVVEGRVMVLAAGAAGSAPAAGGSSPSLPGPQAAHESRAGGEAAVEPASSASTSLSAGEQVTVADGVIAQPKRANIAQATAWMQHRLIFDASRLADVVDEFNRYNTRQLVIENTELADLHISGVYSSTDPTSLIRFLKEQPGVQVVESDSVVRIR
jgi:transmembrane sensor